MTTLGIDIETFSSVSLKKAGVYRYVESDDFEILLFCWQVNAEPVQIVDLAAGEEIPVEVCDMLWNDSVQKSAYNAAFEVACLSKHFGEPLPLGGWICTMAKAAMLGLPFGLDRVGRVLNLAIQKDKAGSALIKYFCVPCKPTKANGMRSRNLPGHAPESWEAFRRYCMTDVSAERSVANKIGFFTVPMFEKDVWQLDMKINMRGVRLDRKLITNAVAFSEAYTEKLTAEAVAITGLGSPNSVKQLKAWLSEALDMEVDDLKKETIPTLLEAADDRAVRRMLEIRVEMAKTSVKKYSAMLVSMCDDDRLRGLVQYYGANRTGRFAGRIVQTHNLPKTVMSSLGMARELVLDGDLDILELIFGNVPYVLSQLIRTALTATPGKRLGVSDFSAIEARVIAWLAGEQWRLDVFNGHGKIYEASGAQMFKVPIEQVTKGSELRDKAKIAELALGFQGGVGALEKMGAIKMGLTTEELPDLVRLWREASPNIVQLWYDIGVAAVTCVRERRTMRLRRIRMFVDKNIFFIELPSGRLLSYLRPRIVINKYGHDALAYEGLDQKTNQWGLQETYGGKLVENIVQATARDILVAKMFRLDELGFNIVFHVHDEIVIEEDEARDCLATVDRVMGEPLSWAPGLPLKGDSFETYYYKKE